MSDAFAPVLQELLGSLPLPPVDQAARATAPAHIDPTVYELVYSLMLWEATHQQAIGAMDRMIGAFVDLNELRICLADELVTLCGARYPRAEERAVRLKMTLNEIFRLEHGMSLARLHEISKRDARQFLSELPSLPGFVVARVCLFGLGAHAFPLDDRLRSALLAVEACDRELSTDQCAAWIERQVRAGEAIDAYLKLEHWVTTNPPQAAARKASSRASGGKKTTADPASKKKT